MLQARSLTLEIKAFDLCSLFDIRILDLNHLLFTQTIYCMIRNIFTIFAIYFAKSFDGPRKISTINAATDLTRGL